MVVPGLPHGQGRPRAAIRDAHATVYEASKDRNWKAYASSLYLTELMTARAISGMFSGPVGVEIQAFWPCPKSAKKADRARTRWRVGKPDADNIAKAVCDAANGVLWVDDAQVAVLSVARYVAAEGVAPRVEVRVWALPC